MIYLAIISLLMNGVAVGLLSWLLFDLHKTRKKLDAYTKALHHYSDKLIGELLKEQEKGDFKTTADWN